MPHDAGNLAQRIRLSTPQDTVKGALFRALLAELDRRIPADPKLPEFRKRFEKSAWREFSNFPVAEYLELVHQAADLLEPTVGGIPAAFSVIGAAVCNSFLSSAVGKLAVTMGSGKDPIALLSYAPSVYGVSASYGTRTFVRRGPDEAVLQIRRDFLPPDYHLGVIRTGLAINGHAAQVRAEPLSLLDLDLIARNAPAQAA